MLNRYQNLGSIAPVFPYESRTTVNTTLAQHPREELDRKLLGVTS
jgi:hypothetical protein